jgi:hypothetical protein
MIDNLVEKLQRRTITIDSDDTNITEKILQTANGVISRGNYGVSKMTRAPEQVLMDCIEGTVREYGIAQLAGGQVNEQLPDFETHDRDTYGWDVLACDLRLEIKPQRGNYFNFSEQTLRVLLNNKNHFNYIVTADVRLIENTSKYEIIPKMIIESEDFAANYKLSQFQKNPGSPTYYFGKTPKTI